MPSIAREFMTRRGELYMVPWGYTGRRGNDLCVLPQLTGLADAQTTPVRRGRRCSILPCSKTSANQTPAQGAPGRAVLYEFRSGYSVAAFIAFTRASISALTASRLKLAPRCIGGKSMNVSAYSPTVCCRKTKRQNSWM